MKFFIITLTLLFSGTVLAFGKTRQELGDIYRDHNGFPRCYQAKDGAYYFKWWNQPLTRKIRYYKDSDGDCRGAFPQTTKANDSEIVYWSKYDESKLVDLPLSLKDELAQISQKTNELLPYNSPEKFIEDQGIHDYTLKLNRELSLKYGQIFSAKVFKAFIEKNPKNLEFRKSVLDNFSQRSVINFSSLKDKVSIVVSFGLGWEEKYEQATPIYIREFLQDIKSLGLHVRFLKKNPGGSIRSNAEMIKGQIVDELRTKRNIILVSLCKGTPELLLAESKIYSEGREDIQGRIIGHVNLSGMLGGTFYSDKANEFLLPKLINPILKLIPLPSAKDTASMYGAIDFMRSDVVEGVLEEAAPLLPKDLLYINITGAPLSSQVLENSSPMIPIVKYTQLGKLTEGANDGFLELPKTLIPETISHNQITFVMDSTHLLGDGVVENFRLTDELIRRSLYSSIIDRIVSEQEYSN